METKENLPTIQACLATIKEICAGKNISEEELKHRARLLYLMNRLSFWNDLPVLLEEINYQRSKNNASTRNHPLIAMPSLSQFKTRREKLGLTLREVGYETKVSAATISRIERGNECDYGNVKTLHEFYVSKNG